MAININWGNVPASIEKLPIQEPLQQQGINQLFQQGMQYFNPATQEEFTRKQFAQRLPGIAERLNMMSGGQQRGQAANYELGAQQANLENQILGQRYEHGLNALKLGLTPQFEYLYKPGEQGVAEAALQGLAGSAAQALPGLAAKGAEYLMGGGAGQAAQAAGSLVPSAIDAIKGAFPSPQAPATASPDVSRLAQTAALLKKAGPEAALAAAPTAIGALKAAAGAPAATGAAEVAKQSAAAAIKQGFINGATAIVKYGPFAAVPAFMAERLYTMINEHIAGNKGPQATPLPANWHDMSIEDRYKHQLGRQIATPTGQVTHDEIRKMEYDLGIEPNEKLSWEDRYKAVQAKKGK